MNTWFEPETTVCYYYLVYRVLNKITAQLGSWGQGSLFNFLLQTWSPEKPYRDIFGKQTEKRLLNSETKWPTTCKIHTD
jgi:hypothetical protein